MHQSIRRPGPDENRPTGYSVLSTQYLLPAALWTPRRGESLKSRREMPMLEVDGTGISVSDWSHDEEKILLTQYVSINESYPWLVDVGTGEKTLHYFLPGRAVERHDEVVLGSGARHVQQADDVVRVAVARVRDRRRPSSPRATSSSSRSSPMTSPARRPRSSRERRAGREPDRRCCLPERDRPALATPGGERRAPPGSPHRARCRSTTTSCRRSTPESGRRRCRSTSTRGSGSG